MPTLVKGNPMPETPIESAIDQEAADAWAKLDERERNVLRNADPPIMEADIGPAEREVWSLCCAGLLQWVPQGCVRTPLGSRTLAHGEADAKARVVAAALSPLARVNLRLMLDAYDGAGYWPCLVSDEVAPLFDRIDREWHPKPEARAVARVLAEGGTP